jgi:RNA polymerase sigma factor (sigma-70 family)
MPTAEVLPHLFRTEYRKIVSVLTARFGISHVEIAEDIVSETFVSAWEIWPVKGIPENPAAWLYAVAKNKTLNHLKRDAVFAQKIVPEAIRQRENATFDIDLSPQSINDSQLAMVFAVCNPILPPETQVALALNLLCGFGAKEIATAFLTNTEVIYKRLKRGKAALREQNIKIETPSAAEIEKRLPFVLSTLYLLFNEGYYSLSQNKVVRAELCAEAMRLNYFLIENPQTDQPAANALLALMCYQSSRIDARTDADGNTILYDAQDSSLWNEELIQKGDYFLDRSAEGKSLTKYHLEAGIASWHTQKQDSVEKWENILQLYNQLLMTDYSPMAALNRTFALAKANGKPEAIVEAEKLGLDTHPLYHSLLGYLYLEVDNEKARIHYQTAIGLVSSASERELLTKALSKIS